MVGEPKPLSMYRQPQPAEPPQQVGLGGIIVQSIAMGAGVSFAFAVVSQTPHAETRGVCR